jgi:hypothetical protein
MGFCIDLRNRGERAIEAATRFLFIKGCYERKRLTQNGDTLLKETMTSSK